MIIQEVKRENFQEEYGILCHRVYPTEKDSPPFGSSWCIVETGKSTDPHNHEVGETFFILEGEGKMSIDGQTSPVMKGSVVYIPSYATHSLLNTSSTENLVFISVWWEESPSGSLQ